MQQIDLLNITIRIAILLLLSAASQTAFHKRIWPVGIFTFAVWLTVFRLTVYRAVSIYIGVFSHGPADFILGIKEYVQSSALANFTDFLILVGTVAIYWYLAVSKDQRKK